LADTRVVIDVDINTSAAAQGLRDLQQRFNAFTGALNKNNAIQATASRQYADQLMNLVNSGQFFTAEMVRMQTAAGRLDKTLAKGQATMGQFFSARFLRNSNAAAQVLSLANARAAALQTQFVATAGSANGMRDAIAIRPYEAFNSALAVSTQKLAIHRAMLMQATTHMINFGKNTQWAGRQLMVGFTVPLTIFGGVAGKVFRELEEEAINFKKVYGDIFTTDAEVEEALGAIKELSMEFTKYGIAVKDTMALAGVAAQSGLRDAELMAATTQATRLATLGQMEQAEAMKTIISLQTAFKTSNEGLAESVDFLNIIENQTVLSLQDVAGAIPRVAPVIQGLGGDIKDLAVLLVAMKEGGVTAGEGANALKSSLGRLIVPTKRASDMASDLGINLQQIVEGNRGQLLPMIMELGQALEGVGDLEKQQLLSTIFGKFQYARIGALFDSITRDSSQAARAMDLMSLSAAELGQIAEQELGIVEESVGAKFTAAMERAKVAIAPLGEAFLNLSIPVINFFAQLIEKFNALPDFAKKFAVFGSVLIGVVIPVGTMFLGLLMNLIGTLIKFGALIGIAFKGFTSGGIKGAIDAVSQALNYMSLEEIDAANAAQQLGQSTQIVNAAFRDQVGDATAATVAIEALGLQYAELIIRMREAAALSGAMGPFAVPGAAMGRAAGAQRAAQAVRRNKGGPIPFSTGNTVPGVGNRDTVPAILTPGEFVVNKRASAENRGLLEAINSGDIRKLNGGGPAVAGRGAAAARVVSSGLGLGADDLIAAQMRRRTIGRTSVADDAARAVATRTAGKLTQLEQQRMDAILNVVRREVAENGSISTPKLAQLLSDQKGFSSPVLRKWAESNNLPRSGSSPKSPRMWTRKDIEAVVRQKIVNPMEKSHFGTKLASLEDVQGVVSLRPGDARARLASELQQSGVPVVALTDDWATFSRSLNQAANRSSTEKMTIGQAIDDIVTHANEISFGPAMRNAGASKQDFAEKLATFLRNNYNLADDFTDDVLTSARNSVLPNVKAKVTGLRIPSFQDLAPWSSQVLGRQVSPNDIASIDAALRTRGYRIVETAESGLDKRAIAKTTWRPGDAIERFGDSTAYNLGGVVAGGRVLSRAAQLRRIKDANVGTMVGLEDNALSKVLKLRFNDVKGAKGPADFVRGMFSRWETTPTRISPKENTSMLLKGKKPKYKPVGQEDYLTDMIVSMDKFADTADAFKPIRIGTGFDGAFRVFDGHTRLHAQTVKGLIKRLTGRDTSTMSRDEILEGVRLVQQRSLAGELTDGDILRSVSGQRVLSTRAGRREVERLNERPGLAAPMGSMLNRDTRVLLPEIHGKEIDSIVEAARKANFYGVKKDPDSLMQAMGFISLGGGARYRYEPGKTHNQPERRSFLKNMSKKILDDLVDSGEIMPLRRNKGGEIPGFNQGNIVPGIGRTDTVPAMLTPGEFVVNKDATRRNLNTLKAINNGTIAGFNLGGAAGATNMGPFIPYNPSSGVPPQFPMTGPSSPVKVNIAEVSDRDSAKANKKAAGMGGKAMLAQMGIGTLLSIPGMFAGQAAGEAVGGDTGAMVGAMAGSMLPFMLPYGKIGAGLKGMMGRGGRGAAGVADDIPITEQLWNTIGKSKPTPAVAANVARTAGMAALFNPLTAAIAAAVVAITATAITFKKMGDSNEAEYEAGMQLAKSMSTSAEEIRLLGSTAKDRAKDMEAYLNASESQFIQQEYATRISEAKTKEERKRIEIERDAAAAERGNQTRREAS
jgi:TP901 family phage tail tape measure protein